MTDSKHLSFHFFDAITKAMLVELAVGDAYGAGFEFVTREKFFTKRMTG
jgi:hypothetical protein